MATKSELAWAAGLFEGEGCISILSARQGTNRATTWAKLTILMTDRDVLERFCEIVGTGGVSLHHRASRPRHKDCWSWQAGARKDVRRILEDFMPWFGARRSEKAQIALDLIERLSAKRNCALCGESFEPRRSDQRYCCKQHREKAWHKAAKESGHLDSYWRDYYAKNGDVYRERARRQHAREKAVKAVA